MKALFFTPHAGLWVHTVPEAYIARAMKQLGHHVSMVTCGGALEYCAVMTARGLRPGAPPEQYERICGHCLTAARNVSRQYGIPLEHLRSLVEANDVREARELSEEVLRERSFDVEYFGLPVGKIALYEFTLAHKKMSTDLSDSQWHEYVEYLYNALVMLKAFARYLETAAPDVILTFSPQYSNSNACMQYAISKGIRVLFMESGTNISNRLGTMRVWDWAKHGLVNPALTYWKQTEENPVDEASAKLVVDHFEKLLDGRHFTVFSNAFSGFSGIRTEWGIRHDQKVLLMTLSSYDEAYAALLIGGFPARKVFSDVFRTQADWLMATLEWAQMHPDIFLIVRVHPRDFPNKRENTRSEQSFVLEKILKYVPSNVHVNWPSEGVSLYEIFEETDVMLTGWSITAMEGLILGIPVVTYDSNLPSYPADIHFTGRSREEYFTNIDRAIAAGWSFKNVRNGFRWLAYNFATSAIVVSHTIGEREHRRYGRFGTLWQRLRNRLSFIGQPLDLLGWRRALPGVQAIDEMLSSGASALQPVLSRRRLSPNADAEDQAIRTQLARLNRLLYGASGDQLANDGLARKLKDYLDGEGSA